MWEPPGIEVEMVELEGGGRRNICIAHINVYEESTKANLDRFRLNAAFLAENGVSAVVLPHMHPYGPVLKHRKGLTKRDVRARLALSRDSRYFRGLRAIASANGMDIVLPGFIEAVSNRLYVSSGFFSSSSEELFEVQRKVFLSEEEKALGFRSGSKPRIFTSGDLNFTVFLDDELLRPELFRYASLAGSTLFIVGEPMVNPPKNYVQVAIGISAALHVWMILPGGIYITKEGDVYVAPTIILSPGGDVAYRYGGTAERLILVNAPSSARRALDLEELNIYLKLYRELYRALPRSVGEVGREVDPDKAEGARRPR
ncbi:MAG: nitrilase-related carbon-nitrogen hydrolase [Desulfurococcaceae archaeon]